jgi:pimeloyl-ACP methyl ester carboxylesterase
MVYQETVVRRDQHRIHVRDHPGKAPAIILMHGFPDNLHLYDCLVPYLSPPRRVVLFDFLGWGSSDKPSGYALPAKIKSATWMRSSLNWALSRSSSSRTTPLALRRLIGH